MYIHVSIIPFLIASETNTVALPEPHSQTLPAQTTESWARPGNEASSAYFC